jgi:hypothetical protein
VRLLIGQSRWQSTNSKTPPGPELHRGFQWTTSRVTLFAVATAIATYGLATLQNQKTAPGTRDYARAGKFETPQYGSVKDMEAVSIYLTIFSAQNDANR